MQDHVEAMLKSLVAVAWADDHVHEDEHEVIDALLAAYEIEGEDAEKVREYAKEKRSIEDVPLTELSAHDRRLLLQHAVILTFVDGEQSEKEKEVLDALVAQLKLPQNEAGEIIASAETRAKQLSSLL